MFGDAIGYSEVTIRRRKWFPFQPRHVTMAPRGHIHFHPLGANYCDDFSENSFCANTCRIMNGFFSSPYRWNPWAAVYVTNPKDAADGTSCAWMEGSGYGGKGDDCTQS